MTRLRSATARAPQTTEAATVIAARYAELAATIAEAEAERDAELAATNAAADAVLVPLVAELKDAAKQLKPWWEANVDALTAGRRKSIELGGCVLGYRISPPKVVFAGGTDAMAVTAIEGTELADTLLRMKTSLDKPAILKALDAGAEQAEALGALGFEAKRAEEFFIDRIGSDAARVSA